MKASKMNFLYLVTALMVFLLAGITSAAAQSPTPDERVAAVKASLAKSAEVLKGYEWIETTVVIYKGEQKSTTVNRCYYGADGKLQKVVVTAPPPEKKGGVRGKVAAGKADYMRSAAELVKSYLHPEAARIDASKKAGKMSITPDGTGTSVRLDFGDYLKAGDVLGIKVDLTKNTLMGVTVNSWLKDAKDKVALVSTFGSLNDGTTYPAESTLSAPSQSMEIKVTNSGYKKL